MMITSTYTVSGMTCGHCVTAVTAEVTAIPQVTAVAVDVPTGAVTITSDGMIDVETLRAAIDEAGYTLVA